MTHTALDCFLGANDGRNSSNDLFDHGLILDKSELIAQRLSAQPKGNSMKYAKQGPLEFVPFEYSEVTLENTKRACKVHYRENLTTCDIPVSQQGPFCSRLDQIPSFKNHLCSLYHTRVWKVYPFRNIRRRSISKPARTQKNAKECYFTQCCISSQHSEKYSVFCGAKKPFSCRYVEIWEDHQTCRKENSQCWG